MAKKKVTRDTVKILYERYIKGDQQKIQALQREIERAELAMQLYERRKEAGLTQAELAHRVNTKQSVISRLENADYGRYTFRTIQKVACAVNCALKVELVPKKKVAHV